MFFKAWPEKGRFPPVHTICFTVYLVLVGATDRGKTKKRNEILTMGCEKDGIMCPKNELLNCLIALIAQKSPIGDMWSGTLGKIH